MAERMTSRDDAEYIRFCLMIDIKDLEEEGYTRAEIAAAMVGIGGGIVAAHMGVQKAVAVLESARDAALEANRTVKRTARMTMYSKPALDLAVERAVTKERERCAQIADAFAEENRQMATDTILLDPMLKGGPINSETIQRSKTLMVDGCIHSSMFHAAQNIAAAIRGDGQSTTQK